MMSLDLRKDVIEKIHKQSLNKMQKDMGDGYEQYDYNEEMDG